jgi:putative FmdB family regulatory protein
MPFYEYECQACKFYTEVMQKISDAPLTRCPSCGKRRLKKLVSAPVFRLKGAGWYETDFKGDKEDRRNLAGSDAEEAPKAESASESPKTEAEAPKVEASKPETVTTKGPSKAPPKVAASKSASGSRSAPSKGSSGKRTSTGRSPPKPATKVAASKTRSAPVVRSKSKPAAKAAARKK